MAAVVFFLDLTNERMVDVVLQFVEAGHDVTVHHIEALEVTSSSQAATAAPCQQ